MAFKKAAPVKGKTEKKLPPWLKPEAGKGTFPKKKGCKK